MAAAQAENIAAPMQNAGQDPAKATEEDDLITQLEYQKKLSRKFQIPELD